MDIGMLKDTGSAILKTANTVYNKELYEKLADYIGKVVDLTKVNSALETRIMELEKQIAALKEKKGVAALVKHREDAVVTDNPDHPYCKPCWESKEKLFSLSPVIDGGECPQCRYTVILSYFGTQTPPGGFHMRDEG